ncbi:MAG: DmsC/YnfH family molybdoenzyme membrane anchor subunit, partial [Alphaproteobacteria bacterium]
MNPAYSVILFTVLSGVGYGLLAVLGLLCLFSLNAASVLMNISVLLISLILITAGLVSSTSHLGRPERVWRALSQWRTSWLSREGVLAVLTYVPALLLALIWGIELVPENSVLWAELWKDEIQT